MISDGMGMQADSKAINPATPKYPAAEMTVTIHANRDEAILTVLGNCAECTSSNANELPGWGTGENLRARGQHRSSRDSRSSCKSRTEHHWSFAFDGGEQPGGRGG